MDTAIKSLGRGGFPHAFRRTLGTETKHQTAVSWAWLYICLGDIYPTYTACQGMRTYAYSDKVRKQFNRNLRVCVG